MFQTLLVAVLVGACMLHVAWTVAPASARRAIARMALLLPLPARLARAIRRHAAATGGCACDGCGSAGPGSANAKSGAAVPITVHRRLPR